MVNYSMDKLYDIMNTTQLNYANMTKRLSLKKHFSDLILIYYSIALIVYSLTCEFFSDIFNIKLASYFNIILSVIVLVYSLINGSAHYGTRLGKAEHVLNVVKNLKRELTEESLSQQKKEYDSIMMSAEYRSDLDFFRTLKQKCDAYDLKWYRYKKEIKAKIQSSDEDDADKKELSKLNTYLSEINPYLQQTKIIFEFLYYAVLIITPIVLFIICFL